MQLTLRRESAPQSPEAVPVPAGRSSGREPAGAVDVVDQWGLHSFPASDPPANW